MFVFGFTGLFLFTQMHGLGLSHISRCGFAGTYIAGIACIYKEREMGRLSEIARIAIAEYILVVVLALILGFGLLLFNLVSGRVRWGLGSKGRSTRP